MISRTLAKLTISAATSERLVKRIGAAGSLPQRDAVVQPEVLPAADVQMEVTRLRGACFCRAGAGEQFPDGEGVLEMAARITIDRSDPVAKRNMPHPARRQGRDLC